MPKQTPKPAPLETPIQPPENPAPPEASTPPTSVSNVLGEISTEEAERLKLPAEPPLDTKPAEFRTPLPDSLPSLSVARTIRVVDPRLQALAKGVLDLYRMTGHPVPSDIRDLLKELAN